VSLHNLLNPPLFGCMNKAGQGPFPRAELCCLLPSNGTITPPTPAAAPDDFGSRLIHHGWWPCATTATGLPCCTVFFPSHAAPAIPEEPPENFHSLFPVTAAFHFRPQSLLLQIGHEATHMVACAAACDFVHGKLTTPGYLDAASR
jgi:hypothetical protein